jgi:hypothetical protein
MHPSKYTMCIQACIPPALGAIHNFIQIHDPGEINNFTYEDNINDGQAGGLALGPANVTERTWAASKLRRICGRTIRAFWGMVFLLNIDSFLCLLFFVLSFLYCHFLYHIWQGHYHISMAKLQQKQRQKTTILLAVRCFQAGPSPMPSSILRTWAPCRHLPLQRQSWRGWQVRRAVG